MRCNITSEVIYIISPGSVFCRSICRWDFKKGMGGPLGYRFCGSCIRNMGLASKISLSPGLAVLVPEAAIPLVRRTRIAPAKQAV